MNTDRRMLLGAGAALALPTWMARAFAAQSDTAGTPRESPETPSLANAKQRARDVGKPLLVILTDPQVEDRDAGSVWGEFFAHASQGTWLDLALVEVVCVPCAALGELKQPAGRDVLWAVLIETDEKPGGPRYVEGPLHFVDQLALHDLYGEQVRARAAALAGLVHGAILFGDGALARREAQSVGSISSNFRDHGPFEAAIDADQPVRFRDLDRFAALVRSKGTPPRREQLAAGARVRLFEQDPPGAKWGTSAQYCPPCGMGIIRPASRYFLSFYAQ